MPNADEEMNREVDHEAMRAKRHPNAAEIDGWDGEERDVDPDGEDYVVEVGPTELVDEEILRKRIRKSITKSYKTRTLYMVAFLDWVATT